MEFHLIYMAVKNMSLPNLWWDVVVSVCQLVKLVLQGDGRVVGTEHLGCESRHEATQVLVEDGRVETIKEVITVLLVLLEDLQVLEDSFLNLDKVVVSNRIFTQKVKFNDVVFPWKKLNYWKNMLLY